MRWWLSLILRISQGSASTYFRWSGRLRHSSIKRLFRDNLCNFYWNRFIFDRKRAKDKLAQFFLRHGVFSFCMFIFLYCICIEFLCVYFPVLLCLSVSFKWLAAKTASEMTYCVLGGALNSTHSLTHSLSRLCCTISKCWRSLVVFCCVMMMLMMSCWWWWWWWWRLYISLCAYGKPHLCINIHQYAPLRIMLQQAAAEHAALHALRRQYTI